MTLAERLRKIADDSAELWANFEVSDSAIAPALRALADEVEGKVLVKPKVYMDVWEYPRGTSGVPVPIAEITGYKCTADTEALALEKLGKMYVAG